MPAGSSQTVSILKWEFVLLFVPVSLEIEWVRCDYLALFDCRVPFKSTWPTTNIERFLEMTFLWKHVVSGHAGRMYRNDVALKWKSKIISSLHKIKLEVLLVMCAVRHINFKTSAKCWKIWKGTTRVKQIESKDGNSKVSGPNFYIVKWMFKLAWK